MSDSGSTSKMSGLGTSKTGKNGGIGSTTGNNIIDASSNRAPPIQLIIDKWDPKILRLVNEDEGLDITSKQTENGEVRFWSNPWDSEERLGIGEDGKSNEHVLAYFRACGPAYVNPWEMSNLLFGSDVIREDPIILSRLKVCVKQVIALRKFKAWKIRHVLKGVDLNSPEQNTKSSPTILISSQPFVYTKGGGIIARSIAAAGMVGGSRTVTPQERDKTRGSKESHCSTDHFTRGTSTHYGCTHYSGETSNNTHHGGPGTSASYAYGTSSRRQPDGHQHDHLHTDDEVMSDAITIVSSSCEGSTQGKRSQNTKNLSRKLDPRNIKGARSSAKSSKTRSENTKNTENVSASSSFQKPYESPFELNESNLMHINYLTQQCRLSTIASDQSSEHDVSDFVNDFANNRMRSGMTVNEGARRRPSDVSKLDGSRRLSDSIGLSSLKTISKLVARRRNDAKQNENRESVSKTTSESEDSDLSEGLNNNLSKNGDLEAFQAYVDRHYDKFEKVDFLASQTDEEETVMVEIFNRITDKELDQEYNFALEEDRKWREKLQDLINQEQDMFKIHPSVYSENFEPRDRIMKRLGSSTTEVVATDVTIKNPEGKKDDQKDNGGNYNHDKKDDKKLCLSAWDRLERDISYNSASNNTRYNTGYNNPKSHRLDNSTSKSALSSPGLSPRIAAVNVMPRSTSIPTTTTTTGASTMGSPRSTTLISKLLSATSFDGTNNTTSNTTNVVTRNKNDVYLPYVPSLLRGPWYVSLPETVSMASQYNNSDDAIITSSSQREGRDSINISIQKERITSERESRRGQESQREGRGDSALVGDSGEPPPLGGAPLLYRPRLSYIPFHHIGRNFVNLQKRVLPFRKMQGKNQIIEPPPGYYIPSLMGKEVCPLIKYFVSSLTLPKNSRNIRHLGYAFASFRDRELFDRYRSLMTGKKLTPDAKTGLLISFAKQKTLAELKSNFDYLKWKRRIKYEFLIYENGAIAGNVLAETFEDYKRSLLNATTSAMGFFRSSNHHYDPGINVGSNDVGYDWNQYFGMMENTLWFNDAILDPVFYNKVERHLGFIWSVEGQKLAEKSKRIRAFKDRQILKGKHRNNHGDVCHTYPYSSYSQDSRSSHCSDRYGAFEYDDYYHWSMKNSSKDSHSTSTVITERSYQTVGTSTVMSNRGAGSALSEKSFAKKTAWIKKHIAPRDKNNVTDVTTKGGPATKGGSAINEKTERSKKIRETESADIQIRKVGNQKLFEKAPHYEYARKGDDYIEYDGRGLSINYPNTGDRREDYRRSEDSYDDRGLLRHYPRDEYRRDDTHRREDSTYHGDDTHRRDDTHHYQDNGRHHEPRSGDYRSSGDNPCYRYVDNRLSSSTSVESYRPPPVESYRPPPVDSYRPTPADSYRPPPADSYRPLPADSYRPPPADSYRPPPADFYRGSATDFYRGPAADFYRGPAANSHPSPGPAGTTPYRSASGGYSNASQRSAGSPRLEYDSPARIEQRSPPQPKRDCPPPRLQCMSETGTTSCPPGLDLLPPGLDLFHPSDHPRGLDRPVYSPDILARDYSGQYAPGQYASRDHEGLAKGKPPEFKGLVYAKDSIRDPLPGKEQSPHYGKARGDSRYSKGSPDRHFGNEEPDRHHSKGSRDRYYSEGSPDLYLGKGSPDRYFGKGSPDRHFGNEDPDRHFRYHDGPRDPRYTGEGPSYNRDNGGYDARGSDAYYPPPRDQSPPQRGLPRTRSAYASSLPYGSP